MAGEGLDAAVTVADELPRAVKRAKLFAGDFVCLFDPSQIKLARRLTEAAYFAEAHVIVSYNGDLRGIVEDLLQKQRRVRCSIASFANLGGVLDGAPLLATVPMMVAQQIRRLRPHLATRALPFSLAGGFVELLWPAAVDDDEACRVLRAHIHAIATTGAGTRAGGAVKRRRARARSASLKPGRLLA